ncbi:hypothetical protein Q1695_012410 [Nippostrongylus brasiliensis]|nr:hypothetical protein Q1695_012410 [Nippostrongylus brasiliensis]
MFGYILISNRNQVLFCGGDSSFDTYLEDRLKAEQPCSPRTPSTSSGICSDSSTESLCVHEAADDVTEESPRKTSNQDISHLFLPLISMYRVLNSRASDQIYSTTSNHSVILLKHLRYDYLLISIGNSEKIQRQFLDYVTLGLDIKIGPLLSQIDSDPTSAATATDFLKSLCGLFPCGKISAFLDVRKAAFFQQESETTQPLLQKLTQSLKDDLGLNRLLLVSGHDVLVSATSAKDDGNFLANLASTDLNFVLQEISSLDCLEQGKIFQVWLRSRQSIIPHFVNVAACSTIGELTLICLSEAKYSPLIRSVVTLLVLLDRIQSADDLSRALLDMGSTVEAISRRFLALAASSTSRKRSPRSFVTNPEQTSNFIRTIWRRTEELLQLCNENENGNHATAMNSYASPRSSFSASSMHGAQNSSEQNEKLSIRCEMMVSYIHRQATSILHELCSESYGKASESKLKCLVDAVAMALKAPQKTLVSDPSIAVAALKKLHLLNGFMLPSTVGLEVIAFSVCIPMKSISFTYSPVSKRELGIFLNYSNVTYCVTVADRTGTMYKLCRLQTEVQENRAVPGVVQRFRRPSNLTVFAVALFPADVNNELAQRQTLKLIDLAAGRMTSTLPLMK